MTPSPPPRGREGDDDTAEIDDDRSALRRFFDWCWDTVRTWGPALLTVLLIRSVLAEPFRIPSGSMVPTLAIGDHILVTKFSYGFRLPLTRIPITELHPPERGDVVVFVYPGSDEGKLSYWLDLPIPPFATLDYVKRIVGLPGDEIEVRDNTLYVNGAAQPKTYLDDFLFRDDNCATSDTRMYTEDLGGRPHAVLNVPNGGMRIAGGLRPGDFGPEVVPEGMVFAMGDNRDHSADSRVWGYIPLRNIKGKAQFVWLSYDQCSGSLPIFGSFRLERFGEGVL